MKLGTETGSLVNHLTARTGVDPSVGMGATICMWTDRHAVTIVAVRRANGNGIATKIGVKRDIATRADKNGMSDAQDYTYVPDPSASVQWFSWREKRQSWVAVGSSNGSNLSIGRRREYHDYSF